MIEKHGESVAGKRTPEYLLWTAMKERCSNPNRKGWHNYGGRGITVCPEWSGSFSCFLKDMGRKPFLTAQLDRIDNSKGYSKDNCRWVTPSANSRNKRTTCLITINGITKPIISWAEEYHLNPLTLKHRIFKLNWSPERAVTQPIMESKRRW